MSAEMPNYADQPELAVVALMNLMSRYACCGKPAIAEAALAQLRWIEQDPRIPLAVRENAALLQDFWQQQAGRGHEPRSVH